MLRLFAIVLLGAALATGTAAAQTAPTETNTDTTAPTNTDAGTPLPSDTGTPPPINTSDGATIALSLGNQKIARALFEASGRGRVTVSVEPPAQPVLPRAAATAAAIQPAAAVTASASVRP